ncbi:vegetative cell wall protein gp1-like [Venturia canescens]|uniref:vegetative cell wall protein gp1-like n=1 Tax=Venturia canescens TaxID=32260 RepID=UPI001C9CABF5|nr:vegetative cell wall protein gp1-like [Venturia canescens]
MTLRPESPPGSLGPLGCTIPEPQSSSSESGTLTPSTVAQSPSPPAMEVDPADTAEVTRRLTAVARMLAPEPDPPKRPQPPPPPFPSSAWPPLPPFSPPNPHHLRGERYSAVASTQPPSLTSPPPLPPSWRLSNLLPSSPSSPDPRSRIPIPPVPGPPRQPSQP